MANEASPADHLLTSLSNEEYVAALHAEADTYDPALFPNLCYIIGGDDTPVKIGMSTDVPRRLRQIQQHCPFLLRVLATASGGQLRERAYHLQFGRFWIHGEWFQRAPEIEAEIGRLNSPYPTDDRMEV